MSQNKTRPTSVLIETYLKSIEPPARQTDARALDMLFRKVTGFAPQMWGASIVGYGSYHYIYKSGRDGDFLATGFSARKAALSIYIMPGYANFEHHLSRLGKHKTGRSCLYVNKLADIDMDVLAELIRSGLDDLGTHWPVIPT
ncbi:MAG: DUF1801 domain-containing protein [Paracoccaceae bacterium]